MPDLTRPIDHDRKHRDRKQSAAPGYCFQAPGIAGPELRAIELHLPPCSSANSALLPNVRYNGVKVHQTPTLVLLAVEFRCCRAMMRSLHASSIRLS